MNFDWNLVLSTLPAFGGALRVTLQVGPLPPRCWWRWSMPPFWCRVCRCSDTRSACMTPLCVIQSLGAGCGVIDLGGRTLEPGCQVLNR